MKLLNLISEVNSHRIAFVKINRVGVGSVMDQHWIYDCSKDGERESALFHLKVSSESDIFHYVERGSEIWKSCLPYNYLYFPEMKHENVYVKDSNIHGKGLFAKSDFKEGAELCVSHVKMDELIYRGFGHYINHSYVPNCKLVRRREVYYLTTLMNIKEGYELTLDYSKEDCGTGESCKNENDDNNRS